MTMTGLRTTELTALQPTSADYVQPDEPHVAEAAAAEVSAAMAPVLSEPGVASIPANPDSWRVEVAARLERYRTRRKPRTPRYPSLLLPFDAPESWSRSAPHAQGGSARVATARADHNFAFHSNSGLANSEPAEDVYGCAEPNQPLRAVEGITEPASNPYPERFSEHTYENPSEHPYELSAKVIEFPRSAAIPIAHRSELADPIFDRPRIVEAPEILPPPPALGGMLMEPARQESAERRPEPLFASPSASIPRRVLAALVDGALLATALAAVTAIFLRWNAGWIPGLNTSLTLSRDLLYGPLPLLAAALVSTAIFLWTAYEFLFVVYTGSTPGLRAAGLQLAGFDGSALNRRRRRWRVLASFLSAFSAGLGYLWSFVDEDGLCWHDRITRTHVRPSD